MLLGELWRRLQFWWHRDTYSAELDEEMRLHQDLRAEQLRTATDLAPAQAALHARRHFGNRTRLAEVSRDLWSGRWLDELSQDVRFGIRQLRHAPGFAAVAILSLALGIGANAAIFTLINAVLLTSLPVRDPGALYLLGDASQAGTASGDPTGKFVVASYDFYRHLQDTHVFDGLCAVQSEEVMRVSIRNKRWSAAQPAHAKLVSGNYFDVLGAGAALGRTLVSGDDSAAAAPVGVVSYRYWKEVLNGDPATVGSVLDVTGTPVSIVGVAAPTFYGQTLQPDPPDIWLPLSVDRRLEPERKLLDSGSAVAVSDRPVVPVRIGGASAGPSDGGAPELDSHHLRIGTLRCGSAGGVEELRRADAGRGRGRRRAARLRNHPASPVRRRVDRTAHRLRQHLGSPAGSWNRATGRTGRATRPGWQPLAARPSGPDRKRDARARGRCARARRCRHR